MSVVPRGFLSPLVKDFRPVVDDLLKPIQAAGLVCDPYVLYQGRPRVPQYWVQGQGAVSVEGSYYADRLSITEINDDALARFVPSTDSWDEIAYIWSPLFSRTVSLYQFSATPDTAPVLDQLDYAVGKQLFSNTVLDLADSSVLTSNFDGGIDDSVSFTLAMAVNLQATGSTIVSFGDGSFLSVTNNGLQAKVAGHLFQTGHIPAGPLAYYPLYLVLQIIPPKATLTVGYGTARIWNGSSPVPIRSISLDFKLQGNFEIFSLDMWGAGAPTPIEIIGRYAAVLGAQDGLVGLR